MESMKFLNSGDNLVLSLFGKEGKAINWLVSLFGGKNNLSFPSEIFDYNKFCGGYVELCRTNNYTQPNNDQICHHTFKNAQNHILYNIKHGDMNIPGALTPDNSKGMRFSLTRNTNFPVTLPFTIAGIFDEKGDVSLNKNQNYCYVIFINILNEAWLVTKTGTNVDPNIVRKLAKILHGNGYYVNIFHPKLGESFGHTIFQNENDIKRDNKKYYLDSDNSSNDCNKTESSNSSNSSDSSDCNYNPLDHLKDSVDNSINCSSCSSSSSSCSSSSCSSSSSSSSCSCSCSSSSSSSSCSSSSSSSSSKCVSCGYKPNCQKKRYTKPKYDKNKYRKNRRGGKCNDNKSDSKFSSYVVPVFEKGNDKKSSIKQFNP